jgi:hypothetical protein
VGYLKIIHVPQDGALFVVYHLVGNAPVVWVRFESPCPQCRYLFFPK